MDVLTLSGRDVAALLDTDALVDALAAGFAALTRGEMNVPPRGMVATTNGTVISMPGWGHGYPVGVKLVSVFHHNETLGLPSHIGLMYLADADTGVPLAIMDGTHITTMRTAAAAALSTRLCARDDARVLAVIGGGVQGRAHLALIPRVRDIRDIRVWSPGLRSGPDLAALDRRARATETAADAVRYADVICLCTSATEPVLDPAWVSPGAHITSVGFAPPGFELHPDLARNGRLIVESRSAAFSPPPAGAVDLAGLDPEAAAELGEIVLGRRPGRVDDHEITVYKSMGHAAEDLVAARMVYEAAIATGRGQIVEL